jgi:hypothetical protein
MALPIGRFPEICRWYEGLASLSAWREALAASDPALASWRSQEGDQVTPVKGPVSHEPAIFSRAGVSPGVARITYTVDCAQLN